MGISTIQRDARRQPIDKTFTKHGKAINFVEVLLHFRNRIQEKTKTMTETIELLEMILAEIKTWSHDPRPETEEVLSECTNKMYTQIFR
jgi:hypothetical protein